MSKPLTATIWREDEAVTVTGRFCEAEPDVGIAFPWTEVESATLAGVPVDLTEDETRRAEEALWEQADLRRQALEDRRAAELEDADAARREFLR